MPARMHEGHLETQHDVRASIRPYGLWQSAINADVIASGVRLGDVAWDALGEELIWSQSHQGRGTLFASDLSGSAPKQLTTNLNVRGRLGYGGGEFTVAHGHIYFAADSGRLYRQSLHVNDPQPITPPFGAAAAPAVTPDGRFVAYIHSHDNVDRIALVDSDGRTWPRIVVEGDDFYMQPSWHPGGELFAFVAWNFPNMPWDGSELRLGRFDESAPGGPRLQNVTNIAGAADVSVVQPEFSPDGRLLTYVSDASGYWQIYAYDLQTREHTQLTDAPFEHGVPAWVQGQRTYAFAPDGRGLYYIRNEGGVHRMLRCDLFDDAGRLRPRHTEIPTLFDEYKVMTQIAVPTGYPIEQSQHSAEREAHSAAMTIVPGGSAIGLPPKHSTAQTPAVPGGPPTGTNSAVVPIALIGSAPDIPPRVVAAHVPIGETQPSRRFRSSDSTALVNDNRPDVADSTVSTVSRDSPDSTDAADVAGVTDSTAAPEAGNTVERTGLVTVVARSQAESFTPGLLSQPQAVMWQTDAGPTVHGLYYPPANPRFTDPSGPPPAVISMHGGPTSQSLPEFNAKAQFFTSRGYAFLEPNYRGSTGYGRKYREMLRGNWGVVDMEDAIGGATFLVDNGLADNNRLVIMGSSAGGFTALRALCEYPGFFRAALCLYGVADLFGLALDTHKFESRYTDALVGPLPAAANLYRERSPVFHAHKIKDAVAVFQGTEDNVVPKSQSDAIVAALRAGGVPHEYHVYEGEGHGFRNAATIDALYDAIEVFLKKYVIFT